ncbi:unnamed protein product [Rhodiola kirilowii]
MPRIGAPSSSKSKGKEVAHEPSILDQIDEFDESGGDDMPLISRKRKQLRTSLRDDSDEELEATPEPLIREDLPPVEPAVERPPPATDDLIEWRQRTSSDIADLKGGVADLRSGLARLEDFVRESDARARQEWDWFRSTVLPMVRGFGAPVASPAAPEFSVPSGASPLPTAPASRVGEAGTPLRESSTRGESSHYTGATILNEEGVGDSARVSSPGDDEAAS